MASSGQTQSRMANRSGHFRRNGLILILQKSTAVEENAYNDENGHIIGKETIFMLIKDKARLDLKYQQIAKNHYMLSSRLHASFYEDNMEEMIQPLWKNLFSSTLLIYGLDLLLCRHIECLCFISP